MKTRTAVGIIVGIILPTFVILQLISNVYHDTSELVEGNHPPVNSCAVSECNNRLPNSSRTLPAFIYDDEVDLRIIVLTFNRPTSLQLLLASIENLELDGDIGAVDIWIDRREGDNEVDERTVRVADNFRWKRGPTRVHIHPRHVGIYGQWMTTWRARHEKSKELALIVEDDLSLSPFAYRWLRAARRFYGDRDDVAGWTLQSDYLIAATNGAPLRRPSPDAGAGFLYQLIGTWGFAPHPGVWRRFQDWYVGVRDSTAFRPYVNGLLMTFWYMKFEGEGKTNSMWEMWFIYYCSRVEAPLYTVYNNIRSLASDRTASCLAVNRKETGLHFDGEAVNNSALLLKRWSPSYVQFHDSPVVCGFNGRQTNVS